MGIRFRLAWRCGTEEATERKKSHTPGQGSRRSRTYRRPQGTGMRRPSVQGTRPAVKLRHGQASARFDLLA